MPTFLEQAARYIFHNHALPGSIEASLGRASLDRICVVLPTRRSVFFFKQALANESNQPFLSPDVVAIDDFIQQTCELEPIDPVSLIFEAFDIFKAIDPNIEFDRFTSWASTMLLDFDRIDQYLVNAKEVFSYVSEAKALDRWNLELPLHAQRNATTTASPVTEKYFLLFDNLYKVYSSLRDRLFATTRAYRGMAYRWLSENIDPLLLDNPKYDYFYFVGLNALSSSEEKVIKTLIKAKRAEALWDTDSYYMEKNPDLKAGELLRKYKREGFFGKWKWQSDHLLTDHKHIRVIGVANASMQGKIAGQFYAEWRKEAEPPQPKRRTAPSQGGPKDAPKSPLEKGRSDVSVGGSEPMTAMVLADENLLTPVMYSLDESVEDFNITMGLSLKNSALFTLIDALFELHRATLTDLKNADGTLRKMPKFNHRSILKVLNHPFIRRYELIALTGTGPPGGPVQTKPPGNADGKQANAEPPVLNIVRRTIREIISRNKVLLSSRELIRMGEEHELFQILFTPWDGRPQQALKCFYRLIDLLRGVYRENQDAMETEYLFLFYTLLKRLETILSERHEQVTMRSFRIFLYELIRQTKMPFSGEPASQLQIIGMLETRALDFEKLIIMSVNEKVLPLAKRQHTLIPFDACLEFGLPTHGDQDAIMAYHFYRLLQRAKEIVLLYVLPSDTYGGYEKSRFIHQIEHELVRQNPNIRLTHHSVALNVHQETDPGEVVLRIQKNPRILEQLTEQITKKGIYPSHLNMFVNCSMQYYFNRLVQVAEAEEVEEKLGTDKFGEWIHKTLEDIDRDLSGGTSSGSNRLVQKEDIEAILHTLPERLKKGFVEAYGGYEGESGMNHLLYKVAEKILTRFFRHQLEHETFPVEVLGLEKSLSATFIAQVGGQPLEVKIAGKIDRIDRVRSGVGNVIRVIDYKTGKVEKKDLEIKIENLEETLLSDRKADKVRQLWLYQYILAKKMLQEGGIRFDDRTIDAAQHTILSGIYSFRNIGEGFLENKLAFQANGETPEEFVARSEEYLTRLVTQLLDPTQLFEKTTHLEVCVYCAYKGICSR